MQRTHPHGRPIAGKPAPTVPCCARLGRWLANHDGADHHKENPLSLWERAGVRADSVTRPTETSITHTPDGNGLGRDAAPPFAPPPHRGPARSPNAARQPLTIDLS